MPSNFSKLKPQAKEQRLTDPIRDHTEAKQILAGFVGPELKLSGWANPPEGVKLATLARFQAIDETLKAAFRDVAANALPLTIGQVVAAEFEKRDLLWPELEKSIGFIETRSLKTK